MAVEKKKTPIELKVNLLSADGKKKSELTVESKETYLKNRSATIHDVVVMHLANRRRGTAHTKGRSDVNKTGKKPWKQKGTGNARAGTAASPIWRGGGVVFGPKTRDWSYTVPKKVRRLALMSSVVRKIRDNEVIVLEKIEIKEPKTKVAVEFLNKIEATKSSLLVTAKSDPILNRAVRNIPKIGTTTVSNLNTLDVLKYEKLVLSQEVFEHLSALLKGEKE